MTQPAAMQRATEDWVKTIDDAKGYDAIAPSAYRKLLAQTPRWENFRALLRHTRPGQFVLEAGCGWALASFALAERGVHVTAIDISEKLVSYLRSLQKELGGRYATNLRLEIADVFRLPALQQKFDAVFSDGVYEHFFAAEDRKSMLANIHDVLKEGGLLVMDVPNLHNPFFSFAVAPRMPAMQPFTIKSFTEELEQGGFKIVETGCSFVNPGFVQWTRSPWMVVGIRSVNLVFRFLPRPVRAILAVHLFCVARKI